MSNNVLIIGGVALGPKVAARCSRLDPHAKVTMIDQDEYISYGGCGIPYYLSGDVSQLNSLRTTVAHVIRDPQFFDTVKSVNVNIQTKAIKINRAEKTVIVENTLTKKQETLSYDKLVLALGASARKLPIDGADLENVTPVTNLHHAQFVHGLCASGKVQNAVIIGAGFIGLEVAVALADVWGINVTVIEMQEHILPAVSNEHSARIAEKDLEKLGIKIITSEKITKLEGKDGKVSAVVTEKQTIPADLVISSIGFVPNTDIAKEAGIECIGNGAVKVDEFMRTNDENIYAGGDCCGVKNLITDKYTYLPLGSLANRQGRIIGTNVATTVNNRQDTFAGVVGTWAVKLHELSFAGVGLSLPMAQKEGFDAVCVTIEGDDHAHFYPDAQMTTLQIVVEKKTRKILGFQACSPATDAVKARVDAVAVLMQYGNATIDNLSNLEIAYAPPFASAMDIVNSVANVADNVLEGRFDMIQPLEFMNYWNEHEKNNILFIDMRPAHKHVVELQEKYPNNWLSLPLEQFKERMNEVPKDKKLILLCSSGTRSYEALLLLKHAGYTNMIGSLVGGMQTIKKRGNSVE